MDDLSYILLDSGGSVHMLSKSCLGTTAKLLREIPVEPLQVSVANDEVLCVSRFGLVELWLPCCQVEKDGTTSQTEVRVHFVKPISPQLLSQSCRPGPCKLWALMFGTRSLILFCSCTAACGPRVEVPQLPDGRRHGRQGQLPPRAPWHGRASAGSPPSVARTVMES